MDPKPPTPICKSFQMCRELILDDYTKQYSLIGVLHELTVLKFPILVEPCGFARFTSAYGKYLLQFQLQSLDGVVVWEDHRKVEIEIRDPIVPLCIALHRRPIHFPKAGKYDLVILGNGEEIVRDVFWIHLPNQTPGELLHL